MQKRTSQSSEFSEFSDYNDFSCKIKDTDIVYRQKTPKVVNQYLLGELLGKGAYGKVREALDTNTLDINAIKIIKKQQLRKLPGGGEAGIKQEIALTSKLNHQNVVRFIESFEIEEKEKLYIVLEYIGGGTLQDLVSKISGSSRMPLSQAQCLFRDLMRGLQYVHSKGIVHRDIKPSNLMITTEGVLKVSDFGVAELIRSFDDSSYTSKTQGTPAFQPPEIASGAERFSGFGGDIWAAGVSLYFIVSGKYPFEGSTAYALFENIAAVKYSLPKWLLEEEESEKSGGRGSGSGSGSSLALADLLRGMLEPDKGKRLTVEEVLKHPWMEDESTGGSGSSPSKKGKRRGSVERPQWVEITPTTTMFTKEFIHDIAKLKHDGDSSRKRPWNCICVLF